MIQQLRQAVRALRRAPRLVATVVLTLAVAAGGVGALFSLLNAIVLRQMPVHEPERLISVYPANGELMHGISGATLAELTVRQTVFEGICGFSRGSLLIEIDGRVMRRASESVGASCGQLLGVRLFLGRFVDPSDRADGVDAAAVAVISHAYWRAQFGSDPSVLGKVVRAQGVPLVVVGVLDREAYGLFADQPPDIVVPLGLSARLFGGPLRVLAINAFGRLKDGATLASARAELRSLWPGVWDATTTAVPGRRPSPARSADALRIEPFGGGLSELRVRYRDSLYVLLGLAGLLLLLAVVNVGGILVARATGRQHEMAIQLSLGAGFTRLTSQLALEGLLLALAAAILSVPIAWQASQALALAMWTSSMPLGMRVTPDGTTLGIIAAAAFAIGLLVNMPAIRLMRNGPSILHANSARSVFASTSTWRRSLTVCQVALSVVLIGTAALFARSLASLRTIDLGFASNGLYAVALEAVPGAMRIDPAAYLAEIERRLTATPGISGVTFSSRFPMSATREVTSLLPNYRNLAWPVGSEIPASVEHVAANFFRMLGISVSQGRAFTADDTVGRPGVAIINAALAARLFPNNDAVGGQIKSVVAADPWSVVGVVENATRGDPRISDAPTIYLPGLQEPARFASPMVVVRAQPSVDLQVAVQAAIAPLGRHAVSYVRSVDEQVDRHIARERVLSGLSASASLLGLGIAALGLFGLLAYAVNVRTRELGLRMALGATHGELFRMIVIEGMVLVVCGVMIGLPSAYMVGRLASSLLYQVTPRDPVALAAATIVMLVVGAIASAIPTARIATITPSEALRQE